MIDSPKLQASLYIYICFFTKIFGCRKLLVAGIIEHKKIMILNFSPQVVRSLSLFRALASSLIAYCLFEIYYYYFIIFRRKKKEKFSLLFLFVGCLCI